MTVVTCFYCRREVMEATDEDRDEVRERLMSTFGPDCVDLKVFEAAFEGLDTVRRSPEYGKTLCLLLHGGRS